jgi:membrane protease YdiL (CAAX protease family)
LDKELFDEGLSQEKNCPGCEQPIALESRFCRHCGCVQTQQEAVSAGKKWSILQQLALFYGIFIIACCVATFVDDFKTLSWAIFFDGVFATITVAFFCSSWQTNKYLLKWPNFSLAKLSLYIVIAIIGSVVINFCTDWLNHTLFSQEIYYYGIFASSKYGILLMIFSMALTPAVFEELAFRGYLFQKLTEIADGKQAIFISSFLFAIIHMSVLSLFWMIPLALFLGFIRVKERTIWYGVFVHFFFNLTVCVLELYSIYGE